MKVCGLSQAVQVRTTRPETITSERTTISSRDSRGTIVARHAKAPAIARAAREKKHLIPAGIWWFYESIRQMMSGPVRLYLMSPPIDIRLSDSSRCGRWTTGAYIRYEASVNRGKGM